MAKSLAEQIEAVRRDEERMAEAQKRRDENVRRIVTPIAEKAAAAVHAKLVEELKADLARATLVNLSKEGLKAAVDAFWDAVTQAEKSESAAKSAKSKTASVDIKPAAPAVSLEG